MSEKILQLKDWVGELCWNNLKEFAQIEERSGVLSEDNTVKIKIRIFTDNYKYAIVGIDRKGDEGYLGCVCSKRKVLPGESWTRGSDLKDGKFNRETWDGILRDIIRNELQKLSDYIRAGRPLPEHERMRISPELSYGKQSEIELEIETEARIG